MDVEQRSCSVKIKTKHFGIVEYSTNDVISFVEGLPGFTKYHQYIIIEKEDSRPFSWMQSIENSDISFVIVDPKVFRPNYKVLTPPEDLAGINIHDPNDIKIVALVTMSDDPKDVSMNLKAPIIINPVEQLAIQIILRNTDYDIEYKMFAPSKKVEILYRDYETSISADYLMNEPELMNHI